MKLYRTNHTIRFRDGGQRREVKANDLVLLNDTVARDFVGAGAIKLATRDENILFRHANPHLFAKTEQPAAPAPVAEPAEDEEDTSEDDADEDTSEDDADADEDTSEDDADADEDTSEDDADADDGSESGADAEQGALDGLEPKHVGGGRYRVVNGAGEVVSDDDIFDDKDAAIAWITKQSEQAAADAPPADAANLLG